MDDINLRFQIVIDVDDNDFFSGSSAEEQELSSEDDSNATSRNSEINQSYDLPVLRPYLGNALVELSGRTIHDEDSCQMMPLLTLPGIVLIPGHSLPLLFYDHATISMMTNLINGDRTFGLINSRFSEGGIRTTLDPIGTTAEIRSYGEEQSYAPYPFMRIQVEGRQRFKVLETERQIEGIVMAKVRILPELELEDPGLGSKLNSLDKFRVPPPNWVEDTTPCSSTYLPRQSHKYNKHDFANYTSFPSFVYKINDPHILMKKIQKELCHWNRTLKADCMPCNPKDFSYWVASTLPLDDNQKLILIGINEVTQRLKHELKILEEFSLLCCRDCSNVIANRKDIFSIGHFPQGPPGTYLNPHGYAHEAITLYKAKDLKGLEIIGRLSIEETWFPGYAWRIVHCEQCQRSLGWFYTALDKKLKPKSFWGLYGSALQNKLSNVNDTLNPV